MPKLRTRKTALKRFKVTAKGRIKAFKKGYNHLRSRKASKQLKRLQGNRVLGKVSEKIAKHSANIKVKNR
jgi:large subunit ribosomal protein L35